MVDFSLIVLSKTDSEDIFEMNNQCFNSFVKSVKYINKSFEIILVESQPNAIYTYNDVTIIKPTQTFNFHKFLNIGIQHAIGEYFILSNNDVVYEKTWLKNVVDVSKENPSIKSFSPYDYTSNKLPMDIIKNNNFVLGYDIQKHLTGWCIVMHKQVMKKIKTLDERFDFYYADFDYAMQLQKYNINHALVTKAQVNHLESVSYPQKNTINYDPLPKDTPQYLIDENWHWVLKDKKMIEGVIKFHKKWGSRRSIKIKLHILHVLKILGLSLFSKFVLISKNK